MPNLESTYNSRLQKKPASFFEMQAFHFILFLCCRMNR